MREKKGAGVLWKNEEGEGRMLRRSFTGNGWLGIYLARQARLCYAMLCYAMLRTESYLC